MKKQTTENILHYIAPSEIEAMIAHLTRAKDLIANEENWTKNVSARRADGTAVFTDDPGACKFCSAGAVFRADQDNKDYSPSFLLDILSQETGRDIVFFNDSPRTTHENVLCAFQDCIEALQQYLKTA